MCIHSDWSNDKIYNAGDIVLEDMKHWEANYWVTGIEPDMKESAWKFLGYCECDAQNNPVTSGADVAPATPPAPLNPPVSVEDSNSICKLHPMWQRTLHWTEYSVGDKYVNGNKLWEVVKPEWCYYEPSGEYGHYGWKELGSC